MLGRSPSSASPYHSHQLTLAQSRPFIHLARPTPQGECGGERAGRTEDEETETVPGNSRVDGRLALWTGSVRAVFTHTVRDLQSTSVIALRDPYRQNRPADVPSISELFQRAAARSGVMAEVEPTKPRAVSR